MSITTKLDVFTLKIREKGNKDNFLNLDDIAGFNLIDEISQYIGKNIYLFKIDNTNERTSRIERNDLNGDSLFCRIKIGKFGESSEIVDTLSGSGVFHKEKEHSDTIPLFFHMYVKENSNVAIFHIQRIGNKTLLPEIRNILSNVLTSLREDKFIFELRPLKEIISLSDFLKNSRGELTSINITLEDKNEDDLLQPPVIILKPKNRKQFPEKMQQKVIETTLNGQMNALKELLPKNIRNIRISSVEVELKMTNNGKIKVNLLNSISLTNTLILPIKNSDMDKTGHPSFNYLKDISNKNRR